MSESGDLAVARPLAQSLLAFAAIATGIALYRSFRKTQAVAPNLRRASMWLAPPATSTFLPLIRAGTKRAAKIELPSNIIVTERFAPGPVGAPDVRILVFERKDGAPGKPALLWIHGGGYLFGVPEMSAPLCGRILEQIDCMIVCLDYRLAPEHPFPAALDDCHTVLEWIHAQANALGIDPDRIAIGGESAGAGLAASLAQRTTDEGTLQPIVQLLIYPMLDDRTATEKDRAGRGALMWTVANNYRGWNGYLGHKPGEAEDRPYSAPSRRGDLSGLPPAWIGVGSLDLFFEEDRAYAYRLFEAGVAAELEIVEGAYHGFDIVAFDTPEAQSFHRRMIEAFAAAVLKRP